MSLTVLFAGGGTTGHVSPMLAVADDLRFQDPEARIIMLGTAEGLETRLVPAAGFELLTIDKVPAPRRIDASLVRFPGRLLGTVSAVTRIIRERGVDVVVGVGGYVSSPAYLAARRTGTPIVVHEANARPGLANRLGARLTPERRVGYTFASTPLPGVHVGMPMRHAIEAIDRSAPDQRAAGAHALGLDPQRRTLVVTGGSLGAQAMNEAFREAMPDLMAAGVQVLHITGAGKGAELAAAAERYHGYHVVDYVDGMEHVYAAADLLICRAGAGTVAEVTTVQAPAIYVPLPIGNGEQRLNAADAATAGAARIIEDADFTAATIRDRVIPLVTDDAELAAMAEAARSMVFPTAAARTMVEMIHEAVGRPHPGRPYPPERRTRAERARATGPAETPADPAPGPAAGAPPTTGPHDSEGHA